MKGKVTSFDSVDTLIVFTGIIEFVILLLGLGLETCNYLQRKRMAWQDFGSYCYSPVYTFQSQQNKEIVKMTDIQLIPLQREDQNQFILDNQEAFR